MGLSFDFTDIKNWEQFFFTADEDYADIFFGWKRGDSVMHPTARTVVFGMMAIGMDRITDTNADEVYARFAFMEKQSGAWRQTNDKQPVFLTPAEIHSMIGLKVNVMKETEAQWARRITKSYLSELRGQYHKEMAATMEVE